MRGARRTRTLLLAASVLATSALGVGRAAADGSPEDDALATTLFKEAKALLEAGNVGEACPKLAESQRLHPAGGTLLNLAVCHEREGKTATAWAELRDARVIAEHDGRDDRIALADEHLRALEPKLSKLVLSVAPTVDVPDMELRVDERAVRRPAWGTGMPLDPGEHVIEAGAPGKKPWRAQVTILPDADLKTVVVPDWENDAAAPVIPPPTIAPTPAVMERPTPPPSHDHTAALIVGGVSLATIGMASYFGIHAIAKHQESRDACTTNPCSQTSTDLNDSAKTFADISTVTFAVGAAGLGLAVYLWFFQGDSSASVSTRSLRIIPAVARGRGTLDLTARF